MEILIALDCIPQDDSCFQLSTFPIGQHFRFFSPKNQLIRPLQFMVNDIQLNQLYVYFLYIYTYAGVLKWENPQISQRTIICVVHKANGFLWIPYFKNPHILSGNLSSTSVIQFVELPIKNCDLSLVFVCLVDIQYCMFSIVFLYVQY